MNNPEKATDLNDPTLKKVNEIINKAKTSSLPNEKNLSDLLEQIFANEEKKNQYAFPNFNEKRNKAHFILINKFIIMLDKIFNYPENKRKCLYLADIETIEENKEQINEVKTSIMKIDMDLYELKKLGKLYELYKASAVIFSKNDKNTINDLIDQAILHIGFISKKHIIINYIAFCIIKNVFLKNKEKKEILFKDCQIDDKNKICINLLVDLFSNKIKDTLNVILSYIILRFESFKDTIKEYDLNMIQKAAENSILKIKSLYPSNYIISIEKIVVVFIDEYESLLLLKKDSQQIGQELQLFNINEMKDSKIIEDGKKEEESKNNNTIDDNSESKNIEDNLNKKNLNENKILDKRVNINDLNIILDKIKMDEASKLELRNLFESLNNRMNALEGESKENSQKLEGEINRLNGEVNQLNGEVNQLNGEVNQLKSQNKEIINILGKIQCREQGKAFLNNFYYYLTDKEKSDIKYYKSQQYDYYKEKAKIIKAALDKKFSSFIENEKYKLVINLIDVVAKSLTKGNNNAHSLVVDLYQNDIDTYNKEKKMFSVEVPQIFCFLKGINFEYNFHEAFLFLKEYFDKGLDSKNWREPDFMTKYLTN